jgi:hypothetical protein
MKNTLFLIPLFILSACNKTQLKNELAGVSSVNIDTSSSVNQTDTTQLPEPPLSTYNVSKYPINKLSCDPLKKIQQKEIMLN